MVQANLRSLLYITAYNLKKAFLRHFPLFSIDFSDKKNIYHKETPHKRFNKKGHIMQRKNLIPRLLNISLDVSKIAVCIYSNEADGENHENYLEDLQESLEQQLKEPKDFVNKQGFSGPRRGLELRKKWSQIEYLIECIYNGHTDPCVDGFKLYKIEKEGNLKISKMDAHIPIFLLENALIDKAFEDPFEDAMIDYEISFHLLEDLLPRNEQ